MENEKSNQKEQNLYDKILKENILGYVLQFSEKQLGFHIKKHALLKDKLQTTLEREADFLVLITTQDEKEFILQLEFQARDEPNMILRMQEYHAILQKKYQKPIVQIVYYLGETPSNMRSILAPSEVFVGFQLKSFRDYSYKEFIESENAEEVIMAVLADFEKEKQEEVVSKILFRLSQLKTDITALSKYIKQLLVLARLRNKLPKIIQNQLGNMGTIGYDIEKDDFYLQGLQKGLQKGIEKGIEKGVEKGKLEARRELAISCLKKGLSIEMTAELTKLSIEEVRKLSKEL
ncbi:hypothetical protein [Hugenholtzia roseola]|uniref:hypothetical protein n=1 Tax=Hugenholtzia roseola TaxID=1002 RepID=UPI00041A2E64|nr:hypothetical protein [Hugenholtzia roseola]